MSPPEANVDGAKPETDKLPSKIDGRYAIKELLGRGGFGAVYRAYDELEDRMVALKVIRNDVTVDLGSNRSGEGSRIKSSGRGSAAHSRGLNSMTSNVPSRFHTGSGARRPVTRAFGGSSSAGDDMTEAFKDEFRLLTQLHHPNLASVYDFGRCAELDALFFTQELVEGVDLTEFLKGESREVIVDIFVQLARALDYIHALGLVHEDIKPTNVLVQRRADGQPRAKLIDFGLARMLRTPDPKETNPDEAIVILGTPGFSAPEKVRGEQTDSRSDIYSLAATIYTATRGQRPFAAKSFQDALSHQLDWRPELAGALLPTCGPVVAELVGRMLQPDPEQRPQSARSVVLELLRREASHLQDHQESKDDRQEFARLLVEHLPFVDRSGYLDLLITRASDVLLSEDGEGNDSSRTGMGTRTIRTICVEAPEGMGKHRLMSELRREVQIGGGLFVQASFWSNKTGGLGAFAGIVVQLATALGDAHPLLARFDGLIKLAREESGSDESHAGQLSEFLLAVAKERPYVLHISDLGRAANRFNQFEQLCRSLDHSEARILLCATTTGHRKVSPQLKTLGREQLCENWGLRPFTSEEMHNVLTGILGDIEVIPDLVKMLDKLTGGHPLSFRETLRVLIEESILIRDAGTWTLRGASAAAEALHQTLAQRSESRLDSLGVSAWEIASILFLVEAPLAEEGLADLADLRRERFDRTLDRLEAEGLIVRSAESGSSRISLAHESVREAVRRRYNESLDETRLDLAARIEELEDVDAELLYLRARMLDEAADELESAAALRETAKQLIDMGQPRLGANVLERLIYRLRRHGGTRELPSLLSALMTLMQDAAGSLDDPARELAHYHSGILIAELLHDFRAQSLFWLATCDRYRLEIESDIDRTLENLEHAAAAARKAHDRILELKIANRRAEVLLSMGDAEQAGGYARQAMEILDIPDAEDADVCHIIGVRLRCLSLSGQLGEARRLHERAKPIAARVPVVRRGSYLSGIAYLGTLGGEPDRAIAETEAAIAELRAANTPRMLIIPLHNLGDMLLRNEEFKAAADAFAEALRLSQMVGMDQNVHLNRGFLGYARARLGDLEEGAELLSDAKNAVAHVPGEQISYQQLRLLDAEVAHMRGQSARARRELEEMLAEFHSANEVSLAHWAQDALARIEFDLGTSFIEAPSQQVESDPDLDTVRTKPVR
jgi:serine/threonine protein kinase/tetratricopeptide (TPR) repeat protein